MEKQQIDISQIKNANLPGGPAVINKTTGKLDASIIPGGGGGAPSPISYLEFDTDNLAADNITGSPITWEVQTFDGGTPTRRTDMSFLGVGSLSPNGGGIVATSGVENFFSNPFTLEIRACQNISNVAYLWSLLKRTECPFEMLFYNDEIRISCATSKRPAYSHSSLGNFGYNNFVSLKLVWTGACYIFYANNVQKLNFIDNTPILMPDGVNTNLCIGFATGNHLIDSLKLKNYADI